MSGPRAMLRFAATWVALVAATSPAGAAEAPPEEPAPQEGPMAAFQAANALYLTGHFEDAMRAYAELHERFRIEDPRLYHNFGNACFRSGAYGSAILYYRRALRLDPSPDVAEALTANLDAARRTLQARYQKGGDTAQFVYGEAGSRLYKATHVVGRTTLALLFALFWVGLMALLIARRLWPDRRPLGRAAVPVGVATVLLGVVLWGQSYTDSTYRVAVVVRDDVKLRDGKHESAQGKDIPEGMEVRIVDQAPPWTKVELTNQQQGWVLEGAIKQI